MLQYKIPQNVGIEDRIVGPLTLRQLIIVSVGSGISYALFTILAKAYDLNILEIIVIALPALVAAAAALIKINDLSLPKFALLTLEYNIKPKKRWWDHRAAIWALPEMMEETKEESSSKQADKKAGLNLSELSRILDSGGFSHVTLPEHPDIDQADDGDLVTQAFFGNKKTPTDNMYWRAAKHDQGKRLTLLAKLPATQIKKVEVPVVTASPVTPTPQIIAPKPLAAPLPNVMTTQPVMSPSKKKRRRRKKKNQGIARPDTSVSTLQKNQPAAFLPKTSEKSPPVPPKKSPVPSGKPTGGEFEFKELEQGEIEINLD